MDARVSTDVEAIVMLHSTCSKSMVWYWQYQAWARIKHGGRTALLHATRALDSVWRIGLWQKLLSSNFNGKCFRIILNLEMYIIIVNPNIFNVILVYDREKTSPFYFHYI